MSRPTCPTCGLANPGHPHCRSTWHLEESLKRAVQLLRDLWEWQSIMGTWEAPAWERTRAFLDEAADGAVEGLEE